MKKLLPLFLVLVISVFGEVNLDKPLPTLRLPDGRILKNVTFTKFGPETVIARSASGSLAIRYDKLPDELRAVAEQRRPGGPKWFSGDTSPNALVIKGQVFVQTFGEGPYKFGEFKVYAFPAHAMQNFNHPDSKGVVSLPRPISVTTTDADGRFKLSVPADISTFLFCQTYRGLSDGGTGRYEWRIPVGQFRRLDEAVLNGDNAERGRSVVKIEEVE